MAYPYTFWKLTFGGDLLDTEEEWACGFHIARESSDLNQADLAGLGEASITSIANRISNFYKNSGSKTPFNMRLRWVKIAAIGTNGKYLGAPAEFIFDIPQNGSSSADFVPSTATVITLTANKFKDPGKYNRFYLPTVPGTDATHYKKTTEETDSLAENAADMVQYINAETLGIFSGVKVRAVSQRTDIYRAIETIRVGNIVDVQRRRRNALIEQYSEHGVDFA